MQSGGAVPPPPPFSSFPYLFPTNPQLNPFQPQQQRFKIKRQRQRVDAGEPRNSYQGVKNGITQDSLTAMFPWIGQMDGEVKEDQPTDLSVPTDLSSTRGDDDETQQLEEELDQLDVENKGEENETLEVLKDEEEQRPANDSPASNDSGSSSGSSSSKRKQQQPQKNTTETVDEVDENGGDGLETTTLGSTEEGLEDSVTPSEENPLEKLTALQSQLASPSLHDMMEAQRRLCSNLFEQQKKLMQQNEEKPRVRDFSLLAQSLKSELSENLSSIVDRILKEWAADLARLAAEAQRPVPMPPMFPNFAQPNPLSFGLPPGPPSGIFPSFNGFNPLAALNSLRRPMMDDDLKRKRAKVTDSVRKTGTPLGRESPSSARSSPQLNLATPLSSYFPPTMVGHPLYGTSFVDREDSPTNSDDNSDCGPYDASQSSTLTPMHLRKAKLMFFFTRYPNSTLLKTYFPDIRFNKNNTAQLVKWFSNFREFYYNQIEKFARTTLAEGSTRRDQITVTKDSEIMKGLNQHYNRNNYIEPPEKLAYVVQETLREFFEAIQQGKDSEASWKKPIYKVIARFDDTIPEYFKDPNFLERLEQQ